MLFNKHKSNRIGPSTGIMKWINKFFRFILFPFIHPIIFIVFLIVFVGGAVGIHHFVGIGYRDIPFWFVDQSINVYNNIFVECIDKNNCLDVFSNKINGKKVIDENKKEEVVRAIHRKAFTKPKEVVDDEKLIDTVKNVNVVKNEIVELSGNELFEYRKYLDQGFVYNKNPRVIKGEISVVDINKISIDNEDMFLYGIYRDPSSDIGVKGSLYLQELVKGKQAECQVVAFTQYAELLAVCVVDGFNVNNKLVKVGYSENIK